MKGGGGPSAVIVPIEAGAGDLLGKLQALTGERRVGAAIWRAATEYAGVVERLVRAEAELERLYAFLQVVGDGETVDVGKVERKALVAALRREWERLDASPF